MKKIYIAGALNADAVGYIKNLHKMIKWSEKVRREGFSVFVPGIDMLVGITMGDLEYIDYFNNSQPWLKASDAVFVTPDSENSEGTKKEMKTALNYGIPIYSDVETMVKELNPQELYMGEL